MTRLRRKGPSAEPRTQRWVRALAVIGGAPAIDLIENKMVARVIHGMIPLEDGPRGPQVSLTPSGTLADPQQIIADLQRQLAECRAERDEALAERDKAQRRLGERTAERDEALEEQAATAEILEVINSSHGDLTPVFEAALANAVGLCEAKFGTLYLCEADAFRAVATQLAGSRREVSHIR